MYLEHDFQKCLVYFASSVHISFQYDPRFADAFWNSSKVNFITHILLMLTSWALVCDVWYLPPETQRVSKKRCISVNISCVLLLVLESC